MGWWVAAQWLLALGCLLQMFRDRRPNCCRWPTLLLLQWRWWCWAACAASRRATEPRAHCGRCAGAGTASSLVSPSGPPRGAWRRAWRPSPPAPAHLYSATLVWRHGRGAPAWPRACWWASGPPRLLPASRRRRAAGQPARRRPAAGQRPGDRDFVAGDGYLALMLTNERSEAQLHEMHRRLRFPRRHRRAHPRAQPPPLPRAGGRALAEGVAAPCALMMPRRRPLQAHQRRAGPRRRRRGAARGGLLRAREALRAPDIAGRLGGDEVRGCCPAPAVDDAIGVAGRIVAQLGRATARRAARPRPEFRRRAAAGRRIARRGAAPAPTRRSTKPSAGAAAAPCRPSAPKNAPSSAKAAPAWPA